MTRSPCSRFAISLACLISGSTLSAGSHADDPDMARANRLLEEGQALKQRGKVEQGCRKIEESVGVRPGYAAELELSDCRALLGRPARAVQEFSNIAARAAARSKVDTANLSVYQEYIAYAERRIRALSPKLTGLPRIAIVLSNDIAVTPGLKIKLDGISLDPASRGAAVPVDPGHHVVRIAAPGKREMTWEADLTTGEKTAAFEEMENEPPPPQETPPPPGLPSSTASAAVPVPPPSVVSPPSISTAPATPKVQGADGIKARDAGIVTGLALGVAGIGIGTGFGIATLMKRDEGTRLGCGETGEPGACDALRSDYGELVAGEVVGFVGAGIGLGIAGLLFWTRPAPTPARAVQVLPAIGPKGARLGLSGQF